MRSLIYLSLAAFTLGYIDLPVAQAQAPTKEQPKNEEAELKAAQEKLQKLLAELRDKEARIAEERRAREAKKTKDEEVHVIMMLAQAASFDPDPTARYGIRLPVTPDTCELIDERWANWLKWDPLTLVESHGPGLKQLKALYIDCGDIDQYNLVYGARRMHKRLEAFGVPHTYEEFPDNHSSVDYRMDVSLPLLAKALSA